MEVVVNTMYKKLYSNYHSLKILLVQWFLQLVLIANFSSKIRFRLCMAINDFRLCRIQPVSYLFVLYTAISLVHSRPQ